MTDAPHYVEGFGPFVSNRAARRGARFARPEGWSAVHTRRAHRFTKAVTGREMSSRIRRRAIRAAATAPAGIERADAWLRACSEGRAAEGMRTIPNGDE